MIKIYHHACFGVGYGALTTVIPCQMARLDFFLFAIKSHQMCNWRGEHVLIRRTYVLMLPSGLTLVSPVEIGMYCSSQAARTRKTWVAYYTFTSAKQGPRCWSDLRLDFFIVLLHFIMKMAILPACLNTILHCIAGVKQPEIYANDQDSILASRFNRSSMLFWFYTLYSWGLANTLPPPRCAPPRVTSYALLLLRGHKKSHKVSAWYFESICQPQKSNHFWLWLCI